MELEEQLKQYLEEERKKIISKEKHIQKEKEDLLACKKSYREKERGYLLLSGKKKKVKNKEDSNKQTEPTEVSQ